MAQGDVGIYASQISGHLWAPNGSYDALGTVTVGSTSVASIEFTGIPQGYKHLQVRFIGRCGVSGEYSQAVYMRANDDSGANYSRHSLGGNGTGSPYAGGAGSSTYAYVGYITGPASIASGFGAGVIDFLDYSSQTKSKTIRSLTGYDRNGAGDLAIHSSSWYSTAPVTSLKFLVELAGGSFTQYTQFALYGVK